MPKRNRVTTISIDKDLKEILLKTIKSKPSLYNKIDTWDDLVKHIIVMLNE